MLVLSRRIGESIIIGEDIEVTINSISGNQVRVGIQAPRNVRVDREEIRYRKDNSEDANGPITSHG